MRHAVVSSSSIFGGYGLSRHLDHVISRTLQYMLLLSVFEQHLAETQWEICCKCKVIHGNLPPNWRQLDSNVTSKEIGPIKDIISNLGQLGGNAGKLPWEAFPDGIDKNKPHAERTSSHREFPLFPKVSIYL